VTPRGGWPRPTKAAGPILGSAVALLGWTAVAHNSGSGWVQALGGLLAGFVVVGTAGPAVAVARGRVSVETNPADATAGRPVSIGVRANAPLRIEAVAPPGPAALVGRGAGRLEMVPARRGPLTEITIVVASAAPFGLVWWRRRVVIALARPLWVAPLAGPPDPALLAGSTSAAILDRQVPRDARAGEPRGVRPYEAGDPRHQVHWPATAHRGELMVRESERPDAAVPEVWVVLPDDGPAGDAVAERALGTVLTLLARTAPVMLATIERDRSRVEPVYSPAEAGRRLARASASTGAAR
jgi:uncharacterized protein (DUF58 family)